MEFIEKANLFFIIPINDEIKLNYIEDDLFVKKLIEVQKDEFSERMCKDTIRNLLLFEKMTFLDNEVEVKIYINNFGYYNSMLIYVNIKIISKMSIKDLGILINGKNFLHKIFYKEKTLYEVLCISGIPSYEIEENFLFIQLEKTIPEFPLSYDKGIDFIEKNKQFFHKILLRSDTESKSLRTHNHESNFESISNFYGTIDLCSPVTLLQIFQHNIYSETEKISIYDIDHRAGWWLVLTDIIFLQQSILSDALKTINASRNDKKKQAAKQMNSVEKVLLDMKEYWYFEDFTHEITKKVVDKVKDKLGIINKLNSVLSRVESLENTVLREINEEQNEYNKYLNLILFIIAIIQIVPLVHEIMITVIEDAVVDVNRLLLWLRAFIISISFPLLVFIVSAAGKRIRNRNERILSNNLNRRSIDDSD